MKASDLIGKKAIRDFHVTYAGGTVSRSFMEEPIKIIRATDKHIVYEWCENFLRVCPSANDTPNILSYEHCDNHWLDYNELIGIDDRCPIQKILDELDAIFKQVEKDLEAAILAA
jgi:hypothetical protein